MIISFAWTTPAVVMREKCVTRRDWAAKTIQQFEHAAMTVALVEAWDKSPRFGGKCFGKVRGPDGPEPREAIERLRRCNRPATRREIPRND